MSVVEFSLWRDDKALGHLHPFGVRLRKDGLENREFVDLAVRALKR
ncbi:MAG: hypothetical protein AB7K09_16560 [Planctomycetota bacterium]